MEDGYTSSPWTAGIGPTGGLMDLAIQVEIRLFKGCIDTASYWLKNNGEKRSCTPCAEG